MIVLASIVIGLSGLWLLRESVGIGFALQKVVQDFVAGLILIFGRPINIGDRVQLGEPTGIVVRIGFRSSIVRSFQGA